MGIRMEAKFLGTDHENGDRPEAARPTMLDAIDHIAIIASDYQRSKAFYSEILGFRVIREVWREPRQSWKCDMAVGTRSRIELFSFPDSPPRTSGPEAQGLRHLAFSVLDLDAVVAHLRRKKVDVEHIRVDEYTGARFTFFRDPDGLPLELYEAEQALRRC